MIQIFCDGGARGNPGPAAAGFVVEENGKVIYKHSKYLKKATNNVAEYSAVVLALSWLNKNLPKARGGTTDIKIILDSELVAKQMSGVFKIKNENLRNYFFAAFGRLFPYRLRPAKSLEKKTGRRVVYESVSRNKNKLADFLVNKALDENT